MRAGAICGLLLAALQISVSPMASADDPRPTLGKNYKILVSEKNKAKYEAMSETIGKCANVQCVQDWLAQPLQSAGGELGNVVRSFPPRSFASCEAQLSVSIQAGIQCIRKTLDDGETARGLGVVQQVPNIIYNEGIRAANLDTGTLPGWFVRSVKNACTSSPESYEYDNCVVHQVEIETDRYTHLVAKLTNASNLISNKGAALAACKAKFGADACVKGFGSEFVAGFNSAVASGQTGAGDPNGKQGGHPNGSLVGGISGREAGSIDEQGGTSPTDTGGGNASSGMAKPTGQSAAPDQETAGESSWGLPTKKCPDYIPARSCGSGAIQDLVETARHWRRGTDGDWYFESEPIKEATSNFSDLRRDFGDLNYQLNKERFESDVAGHLTETLVDNYIETVLSEGYATGLVGNSADFFRVAQKLKDRLPKKGCSAVADHIDDVASRAPRLNDLDYKLNRLVEKQKIVVAARCMSATQDRIAELSKKLGFVDAKGRPLDIGRSAIRQEDLDRLFYQARQSARERLRGVPGASLVTDLAVYQGEAFVETLTDLPLIRQFAKEAKSHVNAEALASCRGLGSLTSPECREDLKNFAELNEKMSTFYGRFPTLRTRVSVGGATKPVYDIVADRSAGLDRKNLAQACSPHQDVDDPNSPLKAATSDELDALDKAMGKTGPVVQNRLDNIVGLLGRLCDPSTDGKFAQWALDNPAFIRNYFNCQRPSLVHFGVTDETSSMLETKACAERKDFGLVACLYLEKVRDWDESKEIGGHLFSIFGDLMILGGGLGFNPTAAKIAVGAGIGGALGYGFAPPDDETRAQVMLGQAFCTSGYARSIKDCDRVFETRERLDNELVSPRFKSAFTGFIQGGAFGALAPVEVIEKIRAPGSLTAVTHDLKSPSEIKPPAEPERPKLALSSDEAAPHPLPVDEHATPLAAEAPEAHAVPEPTSELAPVEGAVHDPVADVLDSVEEKNAQTVLEALGPLFKKDSEIITKNARDAGGVIEVDSLCIGAGIACAAASHVLKDVPGTALVVEAGDTVGGTFANKSFTINTAEGSVTTQQPMPRSQIGLANLTTKKFASSKQLGATIEGYQYETGVPVMLNAAATGLHDVIVPGQAMPITEVTLSNGIRVRAKNVYIGTGLGDQTTHIPDSVYHQEFTDSLARSRADRASPQQLYSSETILEHIDAARKAGKKVILPQEIVVIGNGDGARIAIEGLLHDNVVMPPGFKIKWVGNPARTAKEFVADLTYPERYGPAISKLYDAGVIEAVPGQAIQVNKAPGGKYTVVSVSPNGSLNATGGWVVDSTGYEKNLSSIVGSGVGDGWTTANVHSEVPGLCDGTTCVGEQVIGGDGKRRNIYAIGAAGNDFSHGHFAPAHAPENPAAMYNNVPRAVTLVNGNHGGEPITLSDGTRPERPAQLTPSQFVGRVVAARENTPLKLDLAKPPAGPAAVGAERGIWRSGATPEEGSLLVLRRYGKGVRKGDAVRVNNRNYTVSGWGVDNEGRRFVELKAQATGEKEIVVLTPENARAWSMKQVGLKDMKIPDPNLIINRIVRDNPGVTKDKAKELCDELMKLFLLKMRAESEGTPARMFVYDELDGIDYAWHAFLLFTKDYRDFSENTFGRFIEHTPGLVKDPEGQRGMMYKLLIDTFGMDTFNSWFTAEDYNPHSPTTKYSQALQH